MYKHTYTTKNPASFNPECTTGLHYHQWAARHKYTCTGSFIAHAFENFNFGSFVPYVYTDIECITCHEHYIEINKWRMS